MSLHFLLIVTYCDMLHTVTYCYCTVIPFILIHWKADVFTSQRTCRQLRIPNLEVLIKIKCEVQCLYLLKTVTLLQVRGCLLLEDNLFLYSERQKCCLFSKDLWKIFFFLYFLSILTHSFSSTKQKVLVCLEAKLCMYMFFHDLEMAY